MTLRPDEIEAVMGEPATQPIRVYAPLQAATTPEERANLLLAEIDRTGALERPAFALFSPTGSGYVNYVATETFEYLTRGNCASASIQYSVLPSALSLTKVDYATHQTRILVNGIVARLMAMPADKRPKFYLFGESLGSQVSEEMFRGTGTSGPSGIGLDAAFWIGTPASTVWRQEMWGTRTVSEAPEVGPGPFYLPRAIRDWDALPAEEKAGVEFLLLQNGDDPVPKFGAPLRVEATRLARTGRDPSARLAARHALAARRHVRHDLHRPAERAGPHAGRLPGGRSRLPTGHPGDPARRCSASRRTRRQMERVQAALRAARARVGGAPSLGQGPGGRRRPSGQQPSRRSSTACRRGPAPRLIVPRWSASSTPTCDGRAAGAWGAAAADGARRHRGRGALLVHSQ